MSCEAKCTSLILAQCPPRHSCDENTQEMCSRSLAACSWCTKKPISCFNFECQGHHNSQIRFSCTVFTERHKERDTHMRYAAKKGCKPAHVNRQSDTPNQRFKLWNEMNRTNQAIVDLYLFGYFVSHYPKVKVAVEMDVITQEAHCYDTCMKINCH